MDDVIPDDPPYVSLQAHNPFPFCPKCGGTNLRVKFSRTDWGRKAPMFSDPILYCLDCLEGWIDRFDRDGQRITVDMRMFGSCRAQRARTYGDADVTL